MRLICPNCVAQYEVDEDVIPAEGRDVQCANCGHTWFQDSVNMLSPDDENSVGVGDPEADVPPELFNDLEGKLDTSFQSTRAKEAQNTDVESAPEEPAEPQAAMPSSQLDQDTLDMLHDEAELSSGETPPAAKTAEVEPDAAPDLAETLDELDVSDLDLSNVETASQDIPADENVSLDDSIQANDEGDDIDAIRRRIMDIEALEETDAQVSEASPTADDEASDYVENIPTDDDFDAALAAAAEPVPEPTPEPVAEADPEPIEPVSSPPADTPFSRPNLRRDSFTPPGADIDDATLDEGLSIEASIDAFVEEVGEEEPPKAPEFDKIEEPRAEERVAENRIRPRAFPMGASKPELQPEPVSEDELSEEISASRRELFPDIDDYSSDIVLEETQDGIYEDTEDEAASAPAKQKSGFMRGLLYGLFLILLVVALYIMTPTIVEFVPQSAGVLEMLKNGVDQFLTLSMPLIGGLVDTAKGLVGSLETVQ